MRHVTMALALLMLIASAVAGQEQTGAIQGVVRDVQGGVLPGATVVVSSSRGLAVETTTGDAGTYRYPALPPDRYEVVARLDGFNPARVADVVIVLGVQLTIDLVLHPAGVAERVEVLGRSPRLAMTQAARATSLTSDEIERLPRGRDFTTIAAKAPGANDERKAGGIAIDGSTGAENRVIIDGMETTDTWIGTPGQYLVTDFAEELQVKSSGYSAEYGGSTGGVLNVVTKSGSNDWHGQALLLFSSDALDAGPRPTLQLVPADSTRAEYVTYPEDRFTQAEPGFTLGGPIVRNRAWFFAGYVPSVRHTNRTLTFGGETAPSTFGQRLERHHITGNVSAQFGPRWRTKAAFSSARQVQHGLLPAQDGTGNPAADYSIDEVVPNYSASASVDYMPGSRAYSQCAHGVLLPRLLQRRRLRGRPVRLPDLVVDGPRRAARAPAASRLHERAVECPPRSCARAALQRPGGRDDRIRGGRPAPGERGPAVRSRRDRRPLGLDGQHHQPILGAAVRGCSGRLRLLLGREQRHPAQPRDHHRWQGDGEQRRPVRAGRVDAR